MSLCLFYYWSSLCVLFWFVSFFGIIWICFPFNIHPSSLAYAIFWLIEIIMVLHIILYNFHLTPFLAFLCFILINLFLFLTYCIAFPSFWCLCGYILSVFFNVLSLYGFVGVVCIIVGILHLILCNLLIFFTYLILDFGGFVYHCCWFCTFSFSFFNGISLVGVVLHHLMVECWI